MGVGFDRDGGWPADGPTGSAPPRSVVDDRPTVIDDQPTVVDDQPTVITARPTLVDDAPLIAPPKRSALGRVLGASPKVALVVVDVVSVTAGLLAAYYLLELVGKHPQPRGELRLGALAVSGIAIHLVLFVHNRLYLSRFLSRGFDEFRRIVNACALAAMGIAVWAFAVKIDLPRSFVVLSFVLVSILVTTERTVLRHTFDSLRTHGHLLRPVVVVGSNTEGRALCAMFETDQSLGYRVVGVIDDEPPPDSAYPWVVGTVDSTLDIVRQTGATGVVIAATALELGETNRLVRELTDAGIHVELSSSLRDIASNRLLVRPLGRFPVVYVEPVRRSGWHPVAKRCFDLVIASVVLVIAAPLLLVCAIAIKLDSPGPVIFRQARVGRSGRRFKVYKLRTMVTDAEERLADVIHLNEADGPLFKIGDDPRVTRVGRFLRSTSLDELPQLVNVLRNQMSMVGPRPALPHEVMRWDPELRNRLRVKPGITGMWQVNGRSDTSFEDYQRLDLYYVDNWSLLADLLIVLETIPVVLGRRGAR
jgi:exopolysaccharide biosynthesis polyprenyl glycosylphosphotransferase